MQLVERIRQTIQKIKIQHISSNNALPINKTDYAIIEKAITLNIEKVDQFSLMCTPNNLKSLAVGFLFTQGLIKRIDDIDKISQQKNIIHITLHQPPQFEDKNFVKTSSGGFVNQTKIEALSMPPNLFVNQSVLFSIMQELKHKQKLFKITGGTHAAAVFTANGKIIACCEDIGRHNALDKVIGECLLTKKDLASCGLALSGRVSFEMLNKAAKARIGLVAAVSAPSSLAIQVAEQCNITLCGFVRNERINIYSHPLRLGLQRINK